MYVISLLIGLLIFFSYEKQYVLHVCVYNNEYLKSYYQNHKNKYLGDSGIDVVLPEDILLLPKSYTKIHYNISFVMTTILNYKKSYSYFLFARSSLSNYPLILVNGVGIIDAGFRGNLSSNIFNPNEFSIQLKKGTKLIQICSHDLSEINIVTNCNVEQYGTRNNNGFGSSS